MTAGIPGHGTLTARSHTHRHGTGSLHGTRRLCRTPTAASWCVYTHSHPAAATLSWMRRVAGSGGSLRRRAVYPGVQVSKVTPLVLRVRPGRHRNICNTASFWWSCLTGRVDAGLPFWWGSLAAGVEREREVRKAGEGPSQLSPRALQDRRQGPGQWAGR